MTTDRMKLEAIAQGLARNIKSEKDLSDLSLENRALKGIIEKKL